MDKEKYTVVLRSIKEDISYIARESGLKLEKRKIDFCSIGIFLWTPYFLGGADIFSKQNTK